MRTLIALGTASALALALAAPAGALIRPLTGEDRIHAPLVDAREGRAQVPAQVRRARQAMLEALGPQGFLSVDRVSGGVRFMGRSDGYLSGPAAGGARAVALRWVRDHLDVLGLEPADLDGLRVASRYRAPNGVTRLIFQQRFRGVPAFDNALRVNVARDGRIVNVGGAARSRLRVPSIAPRLGAAAALRAAATGVGAAGAPPLRVVRGARGPRRETLYAGRHRAALTIVSTGARSARLAWRVWFEESSTAVWDVLVDARDGRLLRRAPKVKWANGLVYDFYPGAPHGGEARTVDFSRWLTRPDALRGNNTHVYNDAFNHEECHHVPGTEGCTSDDEDPTQADGDLVLPSEEIRPQGVVSGDWLYPYTPVPSPAGFCPPAGCTWNHLVNGSWVPNREQDGTQIFFFVNAFHDHLAAPPISFTEEAGNFQFENPSGKGHGNDGVFASAMDGAAVVAGRPIPLINSDNANMLTRPDGQAPRMQMYLFEPLVVGDVLPYPFSDVSSGSDGTVVYHEYTHGLTNRLIVDAEGFGALDAAQSGAMGEAWSDWYAMDFLMKQGFLRDTEAPAEVKLGEWVDGGQSLVRTEPVDCTLGASIEACPRKRSNLASEGGGGYTYEHFGRIAGGPQVHADGEIWGQTLMDLRRRLVADHGDAKGTERAEAMVTRAMTLSPDNPSYIDMRNAILQADLVAGKRDHTRIWQTFAPRGMGASAAAVDGDDTAPTAAFDLPPGLPAPDQLAPALTVDTPGEGGAVKVEDARFAGTAMDDAGVTSLTADGRPIALDGSTWSARLEVPRGPSTVTFVARDIEDRTATAVRRVVGDARRPALAVRRPSRRSGRIRVRGRARDDVGIASVTVNGRRARVTRKGAFSAKLRRARGGRVRVVATDRAGRVRRKTVRVG